jgi:hypothetical protein
VKRLALVLATGFAAFSASCGGGGSSTPPPTPTGNFSNSSLKGSYAYSMVGTDALNNPGAIIARVGSFTADGNGGISAALEDVMDAGTVTQNVQFTGGSYSISANGKGTLTLVSAGGGLQLTIALNSATNGVMIQTDLNDTSSGSFQLQSPGTFATGITGPYVFDVSGIDASGAPISIVGQIQTSNTASGIGTISGGVFDENDGASSGPSGAQPFSTAGSYTLDTNGNGTAFGRGMISFAGLQFAFYMVDATHLNLIEEDNNFATSGSALQQTSAPTSVTAGGYAFIIGGGSVLGTMGPVGRAGRFTADANGNLSGVTVDDNNNGSVSMGSSFTTATFMLDAANVGTGRGTVTLQPSGQTNAFTAIVYLDSPTHGFIQDNSPGIIGDGSIFAQAGPYTNSGLAGNYVANWSGQNLNLGFEEDFAAQYALSSSNSVSGAIDWVEEASPSQRSPLFSNIELTGSFGFTGDGTQRNTYTFTTNSSPSTTYHFAAYIGGTASAPTILLIDIDSLHVDAGTSSFQSQ